MLKLSPQTLPETLAIDPAHADLAQLKEETLRLSRINGLHRRLAAALEVNEMIEAYSIWLTTYISHELVGYRNSRQNCRHLYYSGHGPESRRLTRMAEQFLDTAPTGSSLYEERDGHHAYLWSLEAAERAGLLLILKEKHPLTSKELELIAESLFVLDESLGRAFEHEKLLRHAHRDHLTGLANRRIFEQQMPGLMETAKRYNRPLTIAAMDLDHFKQVNDTHGHQAGDQSLKDVAHALASRVRMTDLLVRMGGDEFILVMTDTDQASAQVLAERLCRGVSDLQIKADDTHQLGVSIGLAQLQPGESLDQLMERADDILYLAKERGRSQVQI